MLEWLVHGDTVRFFLSCPRSYKKDTIKAELSPLDTGSGSRFTLNIIEKIPDEKEGKSIVKWTVGWRQSPLGWKEDVESAKPIDFLFMGFKVGVAGVLLFLGTR